MHRCCLRLTVLLRMRLLRVLDPTTAPLISWVMSERCRRCGHLVALEWRVDEARVGAADGDPAPAGFPPQLR